MASTPSCAYTRYSQATIIFMCAWKAAPAAQTCSGWVYDNVCLKSTTSVATGSDDNVPAGCVAYTPDDTYWSSADYTAICNHFNGNDCSGSSWSPEGGRCSNYRALLSFGSSYSSPAVWVNSHAFTWNPATPYSQSCTLASERKSTLVYACAVVVRRYGHCTVSKHHPHPHACLKEPSIGGRRGDLNTCIRGVRAVAAGAGHGCPTFGGRSKN